MKELLKKLTEVYGPSGNEGPVLHILQKELKGHVDSMKIDVLGNLIVTKGRGKPRVMLAAHADEIGVAVTHIDKNGFLRFTNVGGLRPVNMLGHRVRFQNGTLGTIGEEKRDSLKDELKLEKMYIDIGARDKAEAAKRVAVGDMGCFVQPFVDTGSRLIAKAFDDRVGCAIVVEALKRMRKPACSIFAVFTAQEEVGVRGARTAAYGIKPDVAVAVDITGTGDTPESRTMAVGLGKGPAIKVMDGGMLASPQVKEALIAAAKRLRIPYQLEVLIGGTTDAWGIQVTLEGIPSGVISIPTRYAHTPSEMVDARDVENCVRLLVEYVRSL
ncbi:MAG: M42 family metallopeptidase [Planctomycetota bacterium]|nr:M42 family metallopeptidase [Planctomycetota bacterium]